MHQRFGSVFAARATEGKPDAAGFAGEDENIEKGKADRHCASFWDPLDILKQTSYDSEEQENTASMHRGDFNFSSDPRSGLLARLQLERSRDFERALVEKRLRQRLLQRASKMQSSLVVCNECDSTDSYVNGRCQICGCVEVYGHRATLTCGYPPRVNYESVPFDPAQHKRGQPCVYVCVCPGYFLCLA
eukprot:Tamp_21287.p1 GENE.Tamp_21287~~Tamp_21287.p1  ORF type:complete len:210 (-),score=20.32 Tamp_21287:522-1088(-)